MKGDLTWGGEHTVQCTDDVLQDCAPEACIILLTCVTPVNLIKSKENEGSEARLHMFHPDSTITEVRVFQQVSIHSYEMETVLQEDCCLFP